MSDQDSLLAYFTDILIKWDLFSNAGKWAPIGDGVGFLSIYTVVYPGFAASDWGNVPGFISRARQAVSIWSEKLVSADPRFKKIAPFVHQMKKELADGSVDGFVAHYKRAMNATVAHIDRHCETSVRKEMDHLFSQAGIDLGSFNDTWFREERAALLQGTFLSANVMGHFWDMQPCKASDFISGVPKCKFMAENFFHVLCGLLDIAENDPSSWASGLLNEIKEDLPTWLETWDTQKPEVYADFKPLMDRIPPYTEAEEGDEEYYVAGEASDEDIDYVAREMAKMLKQ